MKNLLESFKRQVGELLISFGEKLTGEIEKTNARVDKIEERLGKLEKMEKVEKVEVIKEKPKQVKGPSKLDPSNKEDLELLRKFNKDKWALFEDGKAYNKNFNEKITVEIQNFSSEYKYGVYGIAGTPVEVKEYNGDKTAQFKQVGEIINYKKIPLQYEDILSALNIVNWRYKESHSDLCNIIFELKDNVLNIVASDSYRIAKKSIKRKGEDFSISIKGLLLENIKTDFKKYGHNVEVFLSGDNAKITYKNRVVVCNTSQNKMNYASIYKQYDNSEVEIKVPEFNIKAIEGYLKTIKEKNFIIENYKVRGTEIEIDAEGLYGCYNIKFIKDALALNPESICYSKDRPNIPISFKGEYDIVIMPRFIDNN